MLLSLILYGSRARGDHQLRSDVDLLGVVEGGMIHKEVSKRGASFYHYPAPTLLDKSRSGDLFLLHLVSEGKVLHDTMNFFERVKDEFTFRVSYEEEVREAHLILRFVQSRPSLLQRKKGRKRLIWGMRTILIARCAEQGQARFSSSALEEKSGYNGLKALIDGRNTADIDALLKASDFIVTKFGNPQIDKEWPSELKAQRDLLRLSGGIAKNTTELGALFRFRDTLPTPSDEFYE
ncbi:nucleotidyltransferase domain-containing protein [Novosphingobium sp. JCM 18896]|uniref:nucleotidyltransferase domain-containing protein n=1 Tax=Novosphingobium sp. JCM 18896 TaxID=2989731 RepID=UPI002221A461|nr:nucleotidyltransferase domain-containing protein [Novosphingobium sp. JCM 18896]MCW1431578.1 nucleotidyltransferase domain-containing protein [Novosphingobium sp. JCM 18896]